MASKLVIFACVVFAVSDVTAGQVIKNIGCGCGGIDVIPNQILLNQAGLLAQPGLLAQSGLLGQPGYLAQSGLLGQPGYLAGNVGFAPNLVAPALCNGQYALPANNIIQDNSVATNLANTLQLLLVSNLLSNTLPNSPDVVVPAVNPYAGGLSYIC